MKIEINIISVITGFLTGLLLFYLSTFLQKKSTSIISSFKKRKKRAVVFSFIYLSRYLLYCLVLVFAMLYLSAHPLFVIIGYTIFFCVFIWNENRNLKSLRNKVNH